MTPKFQKALHISIVSRIIMAISILIMLSVAYVTRTVTHSGAWGFMEANPLTYSILFFYLIELFLGIGRFSFFLLKSVPANKKYKICFATAAYYLLFLIFFFDVSIYSLIVIWVLCITSYALPVLFVVNLVLDILALKRNKTAACIETDHEKALMDAVAEWPQSYYLGQDTAAEEAEINALAEEMALN